MDMLHGDKGKRKQKRGKRGVNVVARDAYDAMDLDGRTALIQALIPLGMMAVAEELQNEVARLAGPRHSRKMPGQPSRYGTNAGTVRLGGQTIPLQVPRLRDAEGEVPLTSYQRLHQGAAMDEGLFRKVLLGISCRDYEAAAEAVPGAIGMSRSTVSRRFIDASAAKLKAFQQRDVSTLDVVALFVDGKTFADDMMVIAVAVTMTGAKVPIGFLQTDTENHKAIGDFFSGLMKRGLNIERGVLCVVDGAKGLKKAIEKTFCKRALIQRCQWHKRENVVSYLPKNRQSYWRRRLQKAYQESSYARAKAGLKKIHNELEDENQSAAASLNEGLENTLTLHRLGVFHLVGQSLKTTNCIESINAMAEQRCGKIDYWKNSDQKHRWLAAALLDIEPRLRILMGTRHLSKLREAIMRELKLKLAPDAAEHKAAA